MAAHEAHPDHVQTIYVLCCACKYRWFANFTSIDSPLFKLECPNCHEHDSFPSFVPRWYVEALGLEKAAQMVKDGLVGGISLLTIYADVVNPIANPFR